MIYVAGYGQMCNNMIQFGHFYAFARENNIAVIAMRFCYKHPYFKINEQSGYNFFTYIFAKYGAKLGLIPTINFDVEHEDQHDKVNQLKTSKFIHINGWYFRRYELFLRYRAELLTLFDFNLATRRSVNKFLAAHEQKSPKIGIHIRRGDYLKWQNGRYYFPDEEYAKIVQGFIKDEELSQVTIYIVSNEKTIDITYFKDVLKHEVYVLNGSPGEDLCLLSECDYIIGPPSTFSLMAAFYNDSDLYWIFNPTERLKKRDFRKFDYWFKNII